VRKITQLWGVLTQSVGPWQWPVAYLSKCLDPVPSGWPPCLQALVAAVILIRKADKLTQGQIANVKAPHAIIALMNGQGHKWLKSSRMAHYQGLLHENPSRVRLETVQTLHPATFLPPEEGLPDHNCEEVMDEVYSSRPDLMDGSRARTFHRRKQLCPERMKINWIRSHHC
jgi:hypothetical protein